MQTMMTKMRDAVLRSSIIDTALHAVDEGLCTSFTGNFSIIDRTANKIYITPEGVPWYDLKPEMIVEMELTRGRVLSAPEGIKPSREAYLHTLVYRARQDVKAIVHSHSPYALAYAVKGIRIPSVSTESLSYGNDIGLAEFYPPGSILLAQEVSKKLGDFKVCLMKNHGVLTVGDSIEQAYRYALNVEINAKASIISKNI